MRPQINQVPTITIFPIVSLQTKRSREISNPLGQRQRYYTYVVNNNNGFLSPNPTVARLNGLTDQVFVGRKQLIGYQQTQNTNNGTPIANTSQFDVNAIQNLSTFSRETNAPSFSPPFNAVDLGAPDNGPGTSTPTGPMPLLRLRLIRTSSSRRVTDQLYPFRWHDCRSRRTSRQNAFPAQPIGMDNIQRS